SVLERVFHGTAPTSARRSRAGVHSPIAPNRVRRAAGKAERSSPAGVSYPSARGRPALCLLARRADPVLGRSLFVESTSVDRSGQVFVDVSTVSTLACCDPSRLPEWRSAPAAVSRQPDLLGSARLCSVAG